MPLYRLVYFSRVAIKPDQFDTEVDAILATARARNTEFAITSMLVASPRWFLQAIEGRRHAVSALYGRLLTDNRHHGVELLEAVPAAKRVFPEHALLLCEMSQIPPVEIRRHGADGGFDPAGMTPAMALSFLRSAARAARRAPPLAPAEQQADDVVMLG